MQKDVSGDGNRRGRQRRPLQRQGRPPEWDADAGRRPAEPAVPVPLERRDHERRAPERSARRLLRLLAGTGPAAAADGAEPASARRRHLALHARLGRDDAEDPRGRRGGPAAVPTGRAGRRARRDGLVPARRRRHADPARRRGAPVPRLAGGQAPAGGSGGDAGPDPADPLAGLARERRDRRARRRPGDRPERQGRLDRRRGLPADAARPAQPAHGGRPAPRREDHPARRRRAPAAASASA